MTTTELKIDPAYAIPFAYIEWQKWARKAREMEMDFHNGKVSRWAVDQAKATATTRLRLLERHELAQMAKVYACSVPL